MVLPDANISKVAEIFGHISLRGHGSIRFVDALRPLLQSVVHVMYFSAHIYIFFAWISLKKNIRPHDYKSFFMLNSAEHEISMLDKSH